MYSVVYETEIQPFLILSKSLRKITFHQASKCIWNAYGRHYGQIRHGNCTQKLLMILKNAKLRT